MREISRRELLKGLGATAAVGATAGCQFFGSDRPGRTGNGTGGSGTPPGGYREQFGSVVNLADVGANTEGERSAVSLFREHLTDDTLVYLPQGEYLLDDVVQLLEFDRAGIVGDRATIRPADGYDSTLLDIGRPERGSNFLIEGVEFDVRAPQTGPRVMSLLVGGASVVRDVGVIGTQDAGWGGIRIDTTDPEGVTTVDRLNLPDGSLASVGTSGCYVGDQHVGEIRFNDCHIDGFSDNGLYADTPEGAVRVNGGYFANCDVSSLRVGSDSEVRGAHIRCDRAPEGFENMRGLRLRAGSDILVENCTVEFRDVTYSDGAVMLAHWLESATIRNTHVQIETDNIPAIRVRDPEDGVSDDGSILVENVTIDGPAAEGATVEVDERPDCRFDNLWLYQSGANRDGFLFDDSAATVENTYINVTGQAIRSVEGSEVAQRNLNIPDGASESPSPPDVTSGTPTGSGGAGSR
jgi:hypothetical protein